MFNVVVTDSFDPETDVDLMRQTAGRDSAGVIMGQGEYFSFEQLTEAEEAVARLKRAGFAAVLRGSA